MYQPRLCNGRGRILSRIIRRNTLRQAHGLLLLNVAIEHAHQLSVAGQREYRVACDEHADEREAIRRQYWRNIRLSLRLPHRVPPFGPNLSVQPAALSRS